MYNAVAVLWSMLSSGICVNLSGIIGHRRDRSEAVVYRPRHDSCVYSVLLLIDCQQCFSLSVLSDIQTTCSLSWNHRWLSIDAHGSISLGALVWNAVDVRDLGPRRHCLCSDSWWCAVMRSFTTVIRLNFNSINRWTLTDKKILKTTKHWPDQSTFP